MQLEEGSASVQAPGPCLPSMPAAAPRAHAGCTPTPPCNIPSLVHCCLRVGGARGAAAGHRLKRAAPCPAPSAGAAPRPPPLPAPPPAPQPPPHHRPAPPGQRAPHAACTAAAQGCSCCAWRCTQAGRGNRAQVGAEQPGCRLSGQASSPTQSRRECRGGGLAGQRWQSRRWHAHMHTTPPAAAAPGSGPPAGASYSPASACPLQLRQLVRQRGLRIAHARLVGRCHRPLAPSAAAVLTHRLEQAALHQGLHQGLPAARRAAWT